MVRFQGVYIKDNLLKLRDNGIVKVFNSEMLEELLNELADENERLKQEIKELEEFRYFVFKRIGEVVEK